MATTEQDIESFARFARERLDSLAEDLSIDELFDEWRLQHPPSEDLLAIRASIRDMESGEVGRPLEQFADEFRAGHDLRGSGMPIPE